MSYLIIAGYEERAWRGEEERFAFDNLCLMCREKSGKETLKPL